MRGGLNAYFIVYCCVSTILERLYKTIDTYSAKASDLVPVRESAEHAYARKAHSKHIIAVKAITSTAVQLLLLLLGLLLLLLLLLLGLLLSLVLLLNKRISSTGANLSWNRRSLRIDGCRIKRAGKG